MDLSNPNKTPFEEMTQEEQWALKGAFEDGEVIEFYVFRSGVWRDEKPRWRGPAVYRLKPEPELVKVIREMDFYEYADGSRHYATHTMGQHVTRVVGTITETIVDGKPVEAVWRAA